MMINAIGLKVFFVENKSNAQEVYGMLYSNSKDRFGFLKVKFDKLNVQQLMHLFLFLSRKTLTLMLISRLNAFLLLTLTEQNCYKNKNP